ncbi:MAG: hypothetical protein AAFY25_09360, partial [Pseudomonadota bacterium]
PITPIFVVAITNCLAHFYLTRTIPIFKAKANMSEPFTRLDMWAVSLFVCGFIFTGLYWIAVSHSNLAGFVITTDFMSTYAWPVFWGTGIVSLLGVCVLAGPRVIAAYRERPRKAHNTDFDALVYLLVYWISLYVICISVAPLVSTAVYAAPVQATFTVTGRQTSARRAMCNRSVSFDGLSRWNNTLCRVDPHVFGKIKRCDQVVLKGQANWFGLRVHSVELTAPNGVT